MEDKLYQTFVAATHNVFNLMLNISEVSAHPGADFNCDNEIDIAIGVIGDLQGEIFTVFQSQPRFSSYVI